MFDTSQDLLSSWLEKVDSGDLEGVLALYCEDALLQPTFSTGFLSTPADIRGYFEELCAWDCLRVESGSGGLIEQKLSASLRSLSGLYTWHFLLHDKPVAFEARFTFIVDLSREDPILHHHSSQVPSPLG